jgi:hypothetical protein
VRETIRVSLELTVDEPNSMAFADTYAGLEDVWYKFSADSGGNVDLWATLDGFEHLARVFLKLARTPKASGYHEHRTLEHSEGFPLTPPELTIGLLTPGARAG